MSLASDIHLPAALMANVAMAYKGAAEAVPVLHDITVGFPERFLKRGAEGREQGISVVWLGC